MKLVKSKNTYRYMIGTNVVATVSYYDYSSDNFDWILIADVDTNKEYRRQGLATKLINQVYDDHAKNSKKGIYVMVKQSNDEAIALYNSIGFHKLKKYKGFYIMIKGNADTKQFDNIEFSV